MKFSNAADRIKGVKAILGPIAARHVVDPTGHIERLDPHRVLRYVYPMRVSAEPAPVTTPRAVNIPIQLIAFSWDGDSTISCLSATEFPPRLKWFGATAGDGGGLC